jgi:hypothetical protein
MSPRGGELRRWADEQNPGFIALMATGDHAANALEIGPDAIRASADQFRAVVLTEQHRLESHPSPDQHDRLLDR